MTFEKEKAEHIARLADAYARLHAAYTETVDEEEAERLQDSMLTTIRTALLLTTRKEFERAVAKARKELR